MPAGWCAWRKAARYALEQVRFDDWAPLVDGWDSLRFGFPPPAGAAKSYGGDA